MIQPDDIRRKAMNLYPAFVRAWLQDEPFFPRAIPCRKQPNDDLADAITSVQRLRAGSKAVRGYGYTVQWTEVNSRKHGRNRFPERIVFETAGDFLRYVGRREEFETFANAVAKIRSCCPELESWVRSHIQLLTEWASEVDGLLRVVDHLRAHPRPGVFARELPVPLDTKFVERNRRILREWLDQILPPQTIRSDEEHFERRFGLRYAEQHVMLRFLDPEAQRACGCPWSQLSLPLQTLADLAVDVDRVIIVENKVNLLTLPTLVGTLALGGLGNGVTDLRYLPWLASRPLWYWGDVDVDGLVILSRLRSVFPQARSMLMDVETLEQWRDQLALTGVGRRGDMPPGLTDAEQAAFKICVDENVRVEQERFPQGFVNDFLQNLSFETQPLIVDRRALFV